MKQETSLYILEDDIEICKIYNRELSAYGFDTETFDTLSKFKNAIQNKHCDICILDLSLPDGDALSTLKTTLKDRSIPTVIVSGRGSGSDKVLGLDFGADDYLVKPVDTLELVARINSVLRRAQKQNDDQENTSNNRFKFNDWQADFSKMSLTTPDNEVIELSSADVALLQAFLKSPGTVLSRDHLLDMCQLENNDIFDRSIDVRIARLRKKLENPQNTTQLIKTVYGSGYIFTANVTKY